MLTDCTGTGSLTRSPGRADCTAPGSAACKPSASPRQHRSLPRTPWASPRAETGACGVLSASSCENILSFKTQGFQDANLNFLQNFLSRFITTMSDVQGHSHRTQHAAAGGTTSCRRKMLSTAKFCGLRGHKRSHFPKAWQPLLSL